MEGSSTAKNQTTTTTKKTKTKTKTKEVMSPNGKDKNSVEVEKLVNITVMKEHTHET